MESHVGKFAVLFRKVTVLVVKFLGKKYSISSSFNCHSLGVVYLLGCKVCGKQYVGRTFKSFRTRFNDYKSSSRKFSICMSVAQAELFRHFTEVNHNGFLKDVTIKTNLIYIWRAAMSSYSFALNMYCVQRCSTWRAQRRAATLLKAMEDYGGAKQPFES